MRLTELIEWPRVGRYLSMFSRFQIIFGPNRRAIPLNFRDAGLWHAGAFLNIQTVREQQNLLSLFAIIILLLVLLVLLQFWQTQRRRKLARSRVRLTAREYQLLFDASPIPKWVYDCESLRFVAVNNAAIAQYGYSREQFLAMTIADIRPLAEQPRLESMLQNNFGGGTFYSGIWRHQTRDGRQLLAEIYSHDMQFAGRECRMVLALDVTAREQATAELAALNKGLEERVRARTAELEIANRELAAANQELEAFSYSVAHDLRAPLRALDGYSQALVEDCSDGLDVTGRGYLARIRAGAQRMAMLIDDLLELSRLTRSEMRWQRLNLAALAREVDAELRRSEPRRLVEFILPERLEVAGDAAQMRILLANLLSNAWKFTSHHPRARIELGAEDGRGVDGAGAWLGCFVRDDGAGFDMAWAGKLFRPFQRLHSGNEFPGTGIGLAIVHRIVHRHGGQLRIEAAPERGATVFFTLPAATPAAALTANAFPKQDKEDSDGTAPLCTAGRG